MIGLDALKRRISLWRLRQRFPQTQIYAGASADRLSTLGDFSVLFRDAALINTHLDDYSYVQSGSIICNAEIGKFCSIAGGVNIGLADHPMHMVSTSPIFYDNSQPMPKFLTNEHIFTEPLPRTVVGADVWIGQGAMIKAGIRIGVGAVIGAGSIITKDVEPYVVAAGNPCKPIRLRFPEEICGRLIASEWWRINDKELGELSRLFVDPVKLLAVLECPK